MKGPKLAARRTAIVFAIIASLYLANALLTPVFIGPAKLEAFCRPLFDDTFDGALWKASGFVSEGRSGHYTSSYGTRYRMVDDLLKSHLHIGTDSSTATDILGPPDAGTLDRDSLLASPDPYGGDEADPAKEILESSEDISIWAYYLAPQQKYPARSLWYPLCFGNGDQWKLLITMRNGKIADLRVSM